MNTVIQDTMIEPPNFAYGWYAPLVSNEVKKGKIKSFNFMGTKVIAFRNEEGKIAVLDSVCPHFGADLGKGDVCEGQVRCYFHAFYFDENGQCTKGDLVKDPSTLKKIKVDKYVAKEVAGQIWIWHGPKMSQPDIPVPIEDMNWEEWSKPVTSIQRFITNSNMCYLSENIIDMQHFNTVHHWKMHELVDGPKVEEDGTFVTDIKATIMLAAQSESFFVRQLSKLVRFGVRIHFKVFSPGCAVATSSPGTEMNEKRLARNIVCIYPVDEKTVSIRVACCFKKHRTGTPLNTLMNKLLLPLDYLGGQFNARMGVADFDGDMKVWNNRTYLTQPKFVKEDGPMILFRKWYLRFWHPDYFHELKNPATTGTKIPSIRTSEVS